MVKELQLSFFFLLFFLLSVSVFVFVFGLASLASSSKMLAGIGSGPPPLWPFIRWLTMATGRTTSPGLSPRPRPRPTRRIERERVGGEREADLVCNPSHQPCDYRLSLQPTRPRPRPGTGTRSRSNQKNGSNKQTQSTGKTNLIGIDNQFLLLVHPSVSPFSPSCPSCPSSYHITTRLFVSQVQSQSRSLSQTAVAI